MTTDLTPTIEPKSDQMNADDLISGPRTITVTGVSLTTAGEQPIAINFEGDQGKPYKPCKSMRRVMVIVWGPDGAKYAGRSMTLYRDAAVMFGAVAVGGIRISHMSDIQKPVTLALTVTRASRKPFTVQPLTTARKPAPPAAAQEHPAAKVEAESDPADPLPGLDQSPAERAAQKMIDDLKRCATVDGMVTYWKANSKHVAALPDDLAAAVTRAKDARKVELTEGPTT